jgi:hypothetical protein
MYDFPLNRVIWRDGDVINQNHFKLHERWVENLVGISNQGFSRYGLYRNPVLQDNYNRSSNISFQLIEGSQYRIDLERIQTINPFGKILKIDEKRSLNLNIQLFKRDADGYIVVYLLPYPDNDEIIDQIDRHSEEIMTGTRVYSEPYELSTSNNNGDGVPVLRFRVQGNHLDIDEEYIPYGVFIDSSTYSLNAYYNFKEKFDRLRFLVEEYLLSHSTKPGLQFIWEAASNLHRIMESYNNAFSDPSMDTNYFINKFIDFNHQLKAEFKIFMIGFNQDYYRQIFQNYVEVIDIPIVKQSEQQIDLRYAFDRIDLNLDEMTKFLGLMPEGLDTERSLPIEKVELRKVAGANKLTIYLEGEHDFKQGETLMTIELHSYSQAEPANKNVRVSLGDVAQAMLKDLVNALKPIKGESLSYRIECPKDVINRSRASIISVYVPTPIGEAVPDLKKYISIKVRG